MASMRNLNYRLSIVRTVQPCIKSFGLRQGGKTTGALLAFNAAISFVMAPVSRLAIGELRTVVAVYLLILDQLKVLIFRRFEIR